MDQDKDKIEEWILDKIDENVNRRIMVVKGKIKLTLIMSEIKYY
jgi:hypothetical protein